MNESKHLFFFSDTFTMPLSSQQDYREWTSESFRVDDALGVKGTKLAEGQWGAQETTWFLSKFAFEILHLLQWQGKSGITFYLLHFYFLAQFHRFIVSGPGKSQ